MTPCEYVMWRYRGGSDKEMVKKDANTMTKEEMEALRKKAKEEKVRHPHMQYICFILCSVYIHSLCHRYIAFTLPLFLTHFPSFPVTSFPLFLSSGCNCGGIGRSSHRQT